MIVRHKEVIFFDLYFLENTYLIIINDYANEVHCFNILICELLYLLLDVIVSVAKQHSLFVFVFIPIR